MIHRTGGRRQRWWLGSLCVIGLLAGCAAPHSSTARPEGTASGLRDTQIILRQQLRAVVGCAATTRWNDTVDVLLSLTDDDSRTADLLRYAKDNHRPSLRLYAKLRCDYHVEHVLCFTVESTPGSMSPDSFVCIVVLGPVWDAKGDQHLKVRSVTVKSWRSTDPVFIHDVELLGRGRQKNIWVSLASELSGTAWIDDKQRSIGLVFALNDERSCFEEVGVFSRSAQHEILPAEEVNGIDDGYYAVAVEHEEPDCGD